MKTKELLKKAYIGNGWAFTYDPSTRYIDASHPKGGKQSILTMRMPSAKEEKKIGQLIADFLNGKVDTSVKCPECGAVPYNDCGILIPR